MERIPNIKPGSQLDVFVVHYDKPDATPCVATVLDNGKLRIHSAIYEWSQVGATAREAIELHVRDLREKISRINSSILRWEQVLRRNYPVHPVLSEGDFRHKFPNLSPHHRLEDRSPQELEQMESRAQWEQRRYDEPG